MSADTAVLNQLPAPAVEEDSSADAGAYSLRGSAKLLVQSGTGKAAIALFILLIAISAYVLLTYPLRFGPERWSNPSIWADNPKTVPPFWMTYLGSDGFEHRSFEKADPDGVTQRGAAEVRDFSFPITVDSHVTPTFLSMTLTGLTFNTRAPFVLATLNRPDGGQIRLSSLAVPGPRPGETAPYQRYYDVPERQLLSQQDTAATSLTQWFAQQYPEVPYPSDLTTQMSQALFSRPAADNSGQLETIEGEYTLVVQVAVADPNDLVAPIEVVSGGNLYGWMGTDSIGRDLWEGLLYGFPVALLIAALASILSTFIGASLGIISGYSGGATDSIIQRFCDIITNIPLLPLLIFLVFVMGSHLYLIIIVLVAFSWPGLTILVRSMVLQIRSGQLVEAAYALGASRRRIMMRHVFPQVAPYIVAQMIFFAPGAILAEASLSFIGLGDPSVPTWGQMLEQGFRTGALYIGYWWWVIPPGVLIVFTAIAFMLLALAMEPIVDPRLRRRK
jgi:peptide/nickel transport system permease protein